jgi:uncharacterized RDD family membrane protein YckC
MSAQRPSLLRRPEGSVREIPTPEGVPLRFELALAGDRAGAFLLDIAIITAAALLLTLPAILMAIVDSEAASAFALVVLFALRNFYFSGLEILWRGRTIGKRLLGLQVIDRSGRALRVESLFARNLTREIEVFIPLAVILGGNELIPGMTSPWQLGTLLWALFFALFPFLNRDRLRLGDLLAGTLVVRTPRPSLLPDLAATQRATADERSLGGVVFTRVQLEAYGIYELQVLEKVLREKSTPPETLRAVAEQIADKIGWSGRFVEPRAFLDEFYRAQRAHLEGRLLLGDRREDKAAAGAKHRGGTPPPPAE